jgi:N-acetylglucosamine kinase-like BadF-type ATPase
MANNILVGDIGSTKSVWRKNFGTSSGALLHGYNPVVHAAETGHRLLVELSGTLEGLAPDAIYYFGTGIIDEHARGQVLLLLQSYFPDASITIESDMMGACQATCGDQPGTVAILGTGSNAAVFDGKSIIRKATTLGYLLGDEGSGCDIGKQLAKAYFYNTMPAHLRNVVEPFFKHDRVAFLRTMYASGAPNQLLAESVRGIADVQDDRWVNQLLRECFSSFITTHISPLKPDGPVHVIGSIGYIFSASVKREFEHAGFSTGQFIRDPVQALFEKLNHDNNT